MALKILGGIGIFCLGLGLIWGLFDSQFIKVAILGLGLSYTYLYFSQHN